MTEHQHDMHDPELEALYREAGDVEPDAGLDRIVHARADEARREQASPKRLPWLGGLVTASVAIVAIAVVLQQAPPGESRPETIGPTKLREPEAFMSPSVGAPAEQDESAAANRPDSRTLQTVVPSQQRPTLAPGSVAPEPEAATEEERSRRERNIGEQTGIATETDRVISAEIADDPDRMLAEIRRLLDEGKIERAREGLARLRAKHPDHPIPESIEKVLAPLD